MSDAPTGYVDIFEFARESGFSTKHIYEQIRLGKIPAKQVNRKWWIAKAALKSWKKK